MNLGRPRLAVTLDRGCSLTCPDWGCTAWLCWSFRQLFFDPPGFKWVHWYPATLATIEEERPELLGWLTLEPDAHLWAAVKT